MIGLLLFRLLQTSAALEVDWAIPHQPIPAYVCFLSDGAYSDCVKRRKGMPVDGFSDDSDDSDDSEAKPLIGTLYE